MHRKLCKSASVQKQYGSSSKKLKIELPYNPAIPLLGIYPKKMKKTISKRYIYSNVNSSIIYNSHDMEATIKRWMDKETMMCIYTLKNHGTLKKKEILPFATMRIDL